MTGNSSLYRGNVGLGPRIQDHLDCDAIECAYREEDDDSVTYVALAIQCQVKLKFSRVRLRKVGVRIVNAKTLRRNLRRKGCNKQEEAAAGGR